MADPKARFAWWGVLTADDPFLTPYAYYADWRSVHALGLRLPREHWNRLLDVYRDAGTTCRRRNGATVLTRYGRWACRERPRRRWWTS
jgi:uncharacterized protein YfaS (alpha-2-macroglobulin family)